VFIRIVILYSFVRVTRVGNDVSEDVIDVDQVFNLDSVVRELANTAGVAESRIHRPYSCQFKDGGGFTPIVPKDTEKTMYIGKCHKKHGIAVKYVCGSACVQCKRDKAMAKAMGNVDSYQLT